MPHFFGPLVTLFLSPFVVLSGWLGFRAGWAPVIPPASTTTESVVCTMEAKECPNGSWVGRVPPACDFAPCPGATSTEPAPQPSPAPAPVPAAAAVSIVSLMPSSGAAGSEVTLGGSGFTTDNTVDFAPPGEVGSLIEHVSAKPAIFNCPMMRAGDAGACGAYAQTLAFTVPETAPGTYDVSVENANGKSNTVAFSVVAGEPSATSSVYLQSIEPTSGPIGTSITLTGFGFSRSGNVVHFAGGAIGDLAAMPGPAIACTTDPNCHGGIRWSITFTVPDSIGPYCAPGTACPMFQQLITPGTYNVYVQNDGGTSNKLTFTVTGGRASSQ